MCQVTGQSQEMVDTFMRRLVESRYFVPVYFNNPIVYPGTVKVSGRTTDAIFRYTNVQSLVPYSHPVIYVYTDSSCLERDVPSLTSHNNNVYLVKLGSVEYHNQRFIIDNVNDESQVLTYIINGIEKHEPTPSNIDTVVSRFDVLEKSNTPYSKAVCDLYRKYRQQPIIPSSTSSNDFEEKKKVVIEQLIKLLQQL